MVRKASGGVIANDPDAAHPMERDTLRCVHCQFHWIVQPGSGIQRGFCRNCMGPLCGKKECMEKCEHWEAKLEKIEKEARKVVI